ncbi:391_t:CDS:2 [Gigaspora margarita]|uniref:391_t:CDS:1 n=1 Tax=Gigaspora margarita TaxID=4874 RepID=A0ABM8VWZ3_GIGMA|nr:391_t:CDS:2 [Gigaspora margarita]
MSDENKKNDIVIFLLHGLAAPANDLQFLARNLRSNLPYDIKYVLVGASSIHVDYGFLRLVPSCSELDFLIKTEIDSGIPSQNIFLLGFSQGASVALSMALVSQYQLGGIVSLAGFLPYHTVLLKNEKKRNKTTPILMLHGKDDQVVPCKFGDESYKGLKENDETEDFFKDILGRRGIIQVSDSSLKKQSIITKKINNTVPFNKKAWIIGGIVSIIFLTLWVLNNLVADVIQYEKIETNLPHAKSLTKLLAKLIVKKLFTDLKTRYQDRPGGYSRITKLGLRTGDSGLRVIFKIDGVPIIDSEDFSEEGESSQKNYRSEIQVNESKKTEVLERRKKEVGDEYDVYNLEKINANYEKQLSEAKKQEEQMEAKEEVIRDYTRVIKHKELEKEILEVEAQKDNLKEKELKKQISEKDFEISRWEKAAESLDADLKKAKEEKETLRLKFVRVCRELDEYKNVISPE